MINLDNYTDIELSSILYYADYLSLRSKAIPVTNISFPVYLLIGVSLIFSFFGSRFYVYIVNLKIIIKLIYVIVLYFFIFNSPVNLAYLVGSSPIFSKDNKYFKQSVKEYDQIRNKFGESGIISFIEDICNI